MYVQAHQIVYINCVEFLVYQLYLNKAGEERTYLLQNTLPI